MKTLTVFVTREDIAAGRRNDCSECPVAIATKRAIWAEMPEVNPSHLAVRVYPEEIYVYQRFLAPFAHKMSPDLIKWVCTFDRGAPVGPTSFQLQFQTS